MPAGIEVEVVGTDSQARRMLWDLPRVARGAALLHTQYVAPPAWRGRTAITVHDIAFMTQTALGSHRDWLLRLLAPPAIRRAEVVFTVSGFSADGIADRLGVRRDRIVVTPNGVDPQFGPDGDRPARERPYVLVVGAIQPRKDPLTAIAAFAALDRPDLDLVLVGPDRGSGAEVREAIEAAGLVGRVEMVGHATEDELAAWYRGAEALLFPTRYEGFGLPALEAMASGTPVVCSDIAPLAEIVADAGVRCPIGDVAAFTEGLRSALARRDELAAAGRARAEIYSWRALAAATAAGYEAALA